MKAAIDDSAAAFVGTVVGLENDRRWATVDVAEVWKGEVVSTQVEVRGGPKDPPGSSTVVTSVDRTYRLGETYLFVTYLGQGSLFRDNICTRTTRYDTDLDRFRPVSSSTPTALPSEPGPVADLADETDDFTNTSVVIAALVVVLAMLVTGVWLFRRR